jgi:hypothetical protein
MKTRILAFSLALAAAAAAAYAVATPAKVTICHRPVGNTATAQTISVAKNAVPVHLAHGDQLGACPVSGSR